MILKILLNSMAILYTFSTAKIHEQFTRDLKMYQNLHIITTGLNFKPEKFE